MWDIKVSLLYKLRQLFFCFKSSIFLLFAEGFLIWFWSRCWGFFQWQWEEAVWVPLCSFCEIHINLGCKIYYANCRRESSNSLRKWKSASRWVLQVLSVVVNIFITVVKTRAEPLQSGRAHQGVGGWKNIHNESSEGKGGGRCFSAGTRARDMIPQWGSSWLSSWSAETSVGVAANYSVKWVVSVILVPKGSCCTERKGI